MSSCLRGKSLITEADLTLDDINLIFDTTKHLKTLQKCGMPHKILEGKTLAMIFQKSSTRTRVSFEVGMIQLGGNALNLGFNDIQLGKGKETIGDTARTLSRFVDGIMARTYAHQDVIDLAKYGTVPVINGLTDLLHPCQALTDIYTVLEKRGKVRGLKLSYIGDGNNVAHSLMHVCAKVGMDVVICSPSGYEPDKSITEYSIKTAKAMGSTVSILKDPIEAVKNSDVIYTDVWASMGQEAEKEQREKAFQKYQVNSSLLKHAKEDVLVMHCLPANRGYEITDEVIDGPHSVVFDEAENRLHVQKGIMALLMQ